MSQTVLSLLLLLVVIMMMMIMMMVFLHYKYSHLLTHLLTYLLTYLVTCCSNIIFVLLNWFADVVTLCVVLHLCKATHRASDPTGRKTHLIIRDPLAKTSALAASSVYSRLVALYSSHVRLKSTVLYAIHVKSALSPGMTDTSSGLSTSGGGSNHQHTNTILLASV